MGLFYSWGEGRRLWYKKKTGVLVIQKNWFGSSEGVQSLHVPWQEIKIAVPIQGLYRSWKIWKVMEYKNFIFSGLQGHWIKLLVLESHGKLKLHAHDRLVTVITADDKARTMYRQRGVIKHSVSIKGALSHYFATL